MNSPIFHRDIQGLIDQTMPIQQILPCEGRRNHHHFEMIHRTSAVRHRDDSIRHHLPHIFRQNIRCNHDLSNSLLIRIPQRQAERQFRVARAQKTRRVGQGDTKVQDSALRIAPFSFFSHVARHRPRGRWWISAHDGGYQQRVRLSLSIRLHFARKSEPFLHGRAGTHIAFQSDKHMGADHDASTCTYQQRRVP